MIMTMIVVIMIMMLPQAFSFDGTTVLPLGADDHQYLFVSVVMPTIYYISSNK